MSSVLNDVKTLSLERVAGIANVAPDVAVEQEKDRVARFVSDQLVLKVPQTVIRERLFDVMNKRWSARTMKYFVGRYVTPECLEDARGRLERGEIKATLRPYGKRMVAYVEPERRIGFGPDGDWKKDAAEYKPKRVPIKELFRTKQTLYRNLVTATTEVHRVWADAEELEATGALTEQYLEKVEEAFREVLRAIYPVIVANVSDIKDRDARLGVLSAISFDERVAAKDRVLAVQAASKILGDFQKARENEHDSSLRQLAERAVEKAMERTGIGREEAIRMLSEDAPEITNWLKT